MTEKEINETVSHPSPSQTTKVKSSREPNGILITGTWMLALSLVLLAVYIGMRVQTTRAASENINPVIPPTMVSNQPVDSLPGNNTLT